MSNAALWSGPFGGEYTIRNDGDFSKRKAYWDELTGRCPINSVLEVGCNHGANLDLINCKNRWGCDVNQSAINLLHVRHKEINAVVASGYELPFKDDYFDLVFTCGVLIHQKPSEAEGMMQEIIRVSAKYVLAIEYADTEFKEIPYRGHEGALFKGPYGEICEGRYGLRMMETRFLGKALGFDDCTAWLFRKY